MLSYRESLLLRVGSACRLSAAPVGVTEMTRVASLVSTGYGRTPSCFSKIEPSK
jgi:hypothetical protein